MPKKHKPCSGKDGEGKKTKTCENEHVNLFNRDSTFLVTPGRWCRTHPWLIYFTRLKKAEVFIHWISLIIDWELLSKTLISQKFGLQCSQATISPFSFLFSLPHPSEHPYTEAHWKEKKKSLFRAHAQYSQRSHIPQGKILEIQRFQFFSVVSS